MKIRTLAIIAFLAFVTVSFAGIGGGVGPYVSVVQGLNDNMFGGGVRGELTFNKYFGVELRASYNSGDVRDYIPIEAGVVGIFPVENSNVEFYGCLGGGYYMLTGDTTVGNLELDPIFGFYGALGLNLKLSSNVKLFIEAKYTAAKKEVSETSSGGVPGVLTWTRTESMEYGIEGVGGDIGVMFTF